MRLSEVKKYNHLGAEQTFDHSNSRLNISVLYLQKLEISLKLET